MAAPYDPVNFIPADVFFKSFYGSSQNQQPAIATVVSSNSTKPSDPLRYAADIKFQSSSGSTTSETHCLLQFVTPQIWRIRYNPKFNQVTKYPDANTRTIVEDKFSTLVDNLQEEFRESEANNGYTDRKDWYWKTQFEQKSSTHWILSSVDYTSGSTQGTINTRLHIFSEPFRIVATRILEPFTSQGTISPTLDLSDASEQVIWETSANSFSYQNSDIDIINNVVLTIPKPRSSQFLGFGEQGGSTVLKKPTFMNYFCYDNFNYQKVYGQGPTDTREPLYHSTPFYLEMNRNPSFKNVTGLMVDNYSQVAIDLGKTNPGSISIATRFNTFDAYVFTADNVPKMIWQYTSLVGRPKLKPRFILGHHQGCYGYALSSDVNTVVESYRNAQIPLDGIHLDVDFQDRYRTFTVNGINFPDPAAFLGNLRQQGVKACTNITPILTMRETDSDPYTNLRQFWDENDKLNPKTNLLVNDKRYLPGLRSEGPRCTRYDGTSNGQPQLNMLDPNSLNDRLSYKDYYNAPDSEVYRDNYVFIESDPNKPQGNYDSKYPYHGGVSYGTNLGTPGYYPDLNRKATRDVWGKQYQELFDLGLEFVWQDMTTPAAGNCYGDMLGFPSRLLISEDTYDQNPDQFPPTKTAIEQWALYSYNLHKATYHGLENLKGRENKRNFIIGRGSQTGMHRYAGLWTGDNGSSWDFWRIAVSQVLSLGYSGLTIAGPDMGGFTKDPTSNLPSPRWCDPELLIRWYSGAFLLPWYRNHYNRHFGEKEFQEPFNYTTAPAKYPQIPQALDTLYASVAPIARYFVQLRYSLIQLLYDTMFKNLVNGLPIARAMLITDPEDTALFGEGADFIDNQYLLGNQILVCPVLNPGVTSRDVYLPYPDWWFPSNLRVNIDGYGPDPLKHAAALGDAVEGGTTISYGCALPDAINNKDQIPFSLPVYVRGGSIIPQLDVKQSINENDLNPIVWHVYPGSRETSHSTYLDDGVSRDSAPAHLPQYKHRRDVAPANGNLLTNGSVEAKSKYREVEIKQNYANGSRFVSISHPINNYDASPNVGSTYTVAIWSIKSKAPTDPSQVSYSFQDQNGNPVTGQGLTGSYDTVRGVLSVEVPVNFVPNLGQGSTAANAALVVKVTGLKA